MLGLTNCKTSDRMSSSGEVSMLFGRYSAFNGSLREKLTVILPLKDRVSYTRFFLDNGVFAGYKYLLLDGSMADENQKLISTYKNDKLKYIRFPPDVTFEDYISKIGQGLNYVDTPYLVMIDNDDLLIPKGTDLAIKALDRGKNLSMAGGDLAGYCHPNANSWASSVPVYLTSTKDLDCHSPSESITRNRINYRPIWNSVSNTSIFRRNWEIVQQSQVVEPHLVEFLMADLMLADGRFQWEPVPHYLRLENQTERALDELAQAEQNTIGSPSWWDQAHEVDRVVGKSLGVNQDFPDSTSRWNLLTSGVPASRRLDRLRLRLRTLISRIYLLPVRWLPTIAGNRLLVRLPIYKPVKATVS